MLSCKTCDDHPRDRFGGGGGVDYGPSHPLFGGAKTKKKYYKLKIVNIMEEIKANSLDRYLIVISTLRHSVLVLLV